MPFSLVRPVAPAKLTCAPAIGLSRETETFGSQRAGNRAGFDPRHVDLVAAVAA